MNSMYSTCDLSLAAFLVIQGFPVKTVSKAGPRGTFAFHQDQALQDLVMGWINQSAFMIDPRAFLAAIKDLKSLVVRMSDGDILECRG